MNMILATANRSIDKFVAGMKEVTVLTTLSRREQVIDRVLELNPHVLLLANSLAGHLDMREIVSRCRSLKPATRIVMLCGNRNDETVLFVDFLIRQGVYDFIVGSVNEDNLKSALLDPSDLFAVEPYLLPDLPVAPEAQLTKDDPPDPGVTARPAEMEVLIVEKIVERETIQKEYVGHITIGVAGLYPRSGATHVSLLIGRFLSRQKIDVGVVLDKPTLQLIRDYYAITGEGNNVGGLRLYDDYAQAVSQHRYVVVDDGCPAEPERQSFYERTEKLLVCPTSPWEIDTLTDYLRDNPIAPHIRFLFWPIEKDRLKDLRANLKSGGCSAWGLATAPDWTKDVGNDAAFAQILKGILPDRRRRR